MYTVMVVCASVAAFAPRVNLIAHRRQRLSPLNVGAAKVTQIEADKVIQAAKLKLNGDKTVKDGVGTLEKIVAVVGSVAVP